jgi:hypothetical protein
VVTNGNYFECWFCRNRVDKFIKISSENDDLKIFGVCKDHINNFEDRSFEEVSLEDLTVYEIMYI